MIKLNANLVRTILKESKTKSWPNVAPKCSWNASNRKFSSGPNSNLPFGLTTLPLEGIRVVDLTRILAGPFCTMLLADLGAEVIKIEKPGEGDESRRWGPPFVGNLSCYFMSVNRNKKSITVDLRKESGQKLVKDLVATSDVLVENYVPGKLKKMGLDYESLAAINPKIIYCSISGFGSTGPYAQRAGLDIIAASVGGLLSITGPEDGEPAKAGVAITDMTTGLYAKGAILAALLQRSKTNLGCKLDCNLLSSQVSLLTNVGTNYINAGRIARRRGTAHESIVPYQSFKCADGRYITIGGTSNQLFVTVCKILGLPDLSSHPQFCNNAARVENRSLLIEIIAEKFALEPLDYWLKQFEGSGVPYGPVNEMDKVFADPQVIYNKSVIEVNDPEQGQTYKLLGPAVHVNSTPAIKKNVSPPPQLGQHTDQVLRDVLKYGEQEIKELKEKQIV